MVSILFFLGTMRFDQTLVYLPIKFLEEIPPWTILTLKFKNRFREEQEQEQEPHLKP